MGNLPGNAIVIPSKNKMDGRKIPNTTEIDCNCGSKMKRVTVKEAYPDKYKGVVITCNYLQKDGKPCNNIIIGGMDDGEGEFFRCQNENCERMHETKEYDACLVCAGLLTKDEVIRLKQQTALQQADLFSSVLQNELEKDENKSNDENELISVGIYLQHKALKPEKAGSYFQKALNIINDKLLQKKEKYDENVETKLIETKFEALNHFASALRDCKKYEESEEKFEEAVSFYDEQNNNIISGTLFGNLLSNYGILLKRMQKFKKAEIQYVTGIELGTKIKDYQTCAFLCNSYALMLEVELKEIAKAEEYYLKAIECSDNDEFNKVPCVMANDFNEVGFRHIQKKNFLFEQNYIVFLKNMSRIKDMEVRINKMIERYKNLTNENQEMDEKEKDLDEKKYILSRLYIWFALSVMRHPKLIKDEIINGENCLKSAIELKINQRRVYSAYAMYLQVIGRRIEDDSNQLGFPIEIEEKGEGGEGGEAAKNVDEKQEEISHEHKEGDWKGDYGLAKRRDEIKKYYILAVDHKQHIDVKTGFTFFEEAPQTQKERSFSSNNCIYELNELFKRSSENRGYVVASKGLCEYIMILYPNEYQLHFIYGVTLFRYGKNLYNLELALIHYEIGLSLFQFDADYLRRDQRSKILSSHYMEQYKKLKQEIGQIIGMNKLFEEEIEKAKKENDNGIKNNDILFNLYLKYAHFIDNELNDTYKATKYFKLCYDMNNTDISCCYNCAVNIHELNNENENNSKLFGDYKIANILFKKSMHLFWKQVVDEDNEMKKKDENEKEKEKPKKCKLFYGRIMVYINQMTCKKSRRTIEEIEEMYEYLLKKYFNEENKNMKINWIDFHFEFVQFLIKHKKDYKVMKLLPICEKYAWELYYSDEIISAAKPILIQRIAEMYALIQQHREWQRLMDKCLNDNTIDDEIDKHNPLYYCGYLYETSLNDYKTAMKYYKKAMDLVAKHNKNEEIQSLYALYSSVYANCLRVVNKDYENCERILKEAMKMVENSDLNSMIKSVPHNMYQKYLAEMKQIEEAKKKKEENLIKIVNDGPQNENEKNEIETDDDNKMTNIDTHTNESLRLTHDQVDFMDTIGVVKKDPQ